MSGNEIAARCGMGWLSGAVGATFGTVGGMLSSMAGASILRSAGWKSVEFTMAQVIKSGAAGSALLTGTIAAGASCIMGTALGDNPVAAVAGCLGAAGVWFAVGAGNALFALPAGAGMLHYFENGTQVGFTFAAGAIGAAVVGTAASCVVACCQGALMAVVRDAAQNLHLIPIPEENVDLENKIIKVGEPKLVAPIKLEEMFPDAPKSAEGIIEAVQGRIITDADQVFTIEVNPEFNLEGQKIKVRA